MDKLATLVEAADLNALLRAVDGLCAARSWDELVDLAEMCEDALERGKQLWPIAAHIDYRLALEAPGDYAASVLVPEVTRFAVGPLTEVAASTHTWRQLAPHIESPQIASYVAQERVLRGEILTGDEGTHAEVLELPLLLTEWEPTYALATYSSDHVEVAEPWDPAAPLQEVAVEEGDQLDETDLVNALLELVQPWTAESNGAARACVVEGSALSAASALTFGRLRMGPLETDEALQRIAWAAASGGAHGRRRGAALGRFQAWYCGAALADLEWPVTPERFGEALDELRWYRWDEGEPEKGWVLRIAVEDSANGWAAALAATDLLTDPSPTG
ncbi:MAG: hypothetical protein M3345_03910 [Actinomycetota bacterium]|nr:hypothetical protein [Actinomycetota bacterium]